MNKKGYVLDSPRGWEHIPAIITTILVLLLVIWVGAKILEDIEVPLLFCGSHNYTSFNNTDGEMVQCCYGAHESTDGDMRGLRDCVWLNKTEGYGNITFEAI